MTPAGGITVGTELPGVTGTLSLSDTVRYAGASGDLNPLHFDPEFAAQVSPTGGIIAHGMYSMGLVSRLLTTWAGGPEKVVALDVRFTQPWPVGVAATFGGRVTSVDDGIVTVRLWARRDDDVLILSGTGRVSVSRAERR